MSRLIPIIILAFALLGTSPLAATAQVRTAVPAERGLSARDFPRIVPLGNGVYAYEALREPGFTTVSLIVVGRDGVLLADGQESVEATQALLDAVATVTDKPIRWMVVGSVHEDHTGGTAALPAHTILVIHPQALQEIKADGRCVEPGPGQVGEVKTIDLGDRTAEVLFLGRAHTATDLLVRIPDQGVVFMSEVFMNRVFPPMRSAFPAEWGETLDRALDLDADWYVPGHGFVDGPQRALEEMQVFRRAIADVRHEARRVRGSGSQPNWGEYAFWMLADSQGPIALQRLTVLSD